LLWSVLEHSYRWLERLPEERASRIPYFVHDELQTLAWLAPFLFTDLRAPLSTVLGATDACPEGLGACECDLGPEKAQDLFLRAELRGERVKLGAVLTPEADEPRARHREARPGTFVSEEIPRYISPRFLVAVHMFSGPRRPKDLHDEWQRLGSEQGYVVIVEDYDLQLASKHNLLDDGFYFWLLVRASRGEISWMAGGPPCGTWSVARYAGPPGPPPVRSRAYPWGLPNLSEKFMKSVFVGSALLVRFVDLCRAVALRGGLFLLEHPEDRGVAPYPSVWDTPLVTELLKEFNGIAKSFDQGALGAPSRKGTTLGGTLGAASPKAFERLDDLRVAPGFRSLPMIGLTKDGQFKTSALQLYPPKLNTLIAHMFCDGLSGTPEPKVSFDMSCQRGDLPPGVPLPHFVDPFPVPGADAGKPQVKPKDEWWKYPERVKLVREVMTWPWKTVFSLSCSDDQHINLKELRAARVYLFRRLSSRAARGSKVLLALDSRVAVGALAHGRSPSPAINRILKSLIPGLLGFNAYVIPLWVPSEANPSDAPSRRRPLWTWRASIQTHLKKLSRGQRRGRR
jgi:hypothetical protein